MTHMAMSSVRVMATCALFGEAVGKAASIAIKNNITPHGVYNYKINELKKLLLNEDCFLPSNKRKISDKCKNAKLNINSDVIRNGEDRAHRIYGTDETNYAYFAHLNEEITYMFDETKILSVHIVFLQ